MVSLPTVKNIFRRKKESEKGSAVVEFMFSTIVWLPVLLGTIVFSINLIRAIQVSQLARDTGHMYAYGIDFSQPQNTNLIQHLATPLGITKAGGNGAVVFSTITLATQNDCDSAKMTTCPNKDKYVFTSIYTFGNASLAQTKLGNPGSYLTNGTALQAATYLSDSKLVATNFSSLLTFAAGQPGQYAFVSEVTVVSQPILWSDFSNTGSYARSIF